ncbi:MAG TPA: DinB family protein [Thermoanaerobaculia bacterium]|nr:DinB family protein [Thermoanaerobaculia bacterium]
MRTHRARIQETIQAFIDATEELITRLERLSDQSATRTPKYGDFTPAQIGWHVGATNQLFTGILTGTAPLVASPGASDFTDDEFRPAVVPRVQAPALLLPPAAITRAESIQFLRASREPLRQALLSLEAERAAGWCVTLPWATVSLYQLGEWASGHCWRHIDQLGRAIGEQ